MKNQDIAILGLSAAALFIVVKSGAIKLPAFLNAGPAPRFTRTNAFGGRIGTPLNPANPGAFIPVDDFVNGTIADFYSGGNAGYATPTIDAITDDVLRETYGTQEPTSIVKRDGAYW